MSAKFGHNQRSNSGKFRHFYFLFCLSVFFPLGVLVGSHVPINPVLQYRIDFGRGGRKKSSGMDLWFWAKRAPKCVLPPKLNWSRMPMATVKKFWALQHTSLWEHCGMRVLGWMSLQSWSSLAIFISHNCINPMVLNCQKLFMTLQSFEKYCHIPHLIVITQDHNKEGTRKLLCSSLWLEIVKNNLLSIKPKLEADILN